MITEYKIWLATSIILSKLFFASVANAELLASDNGVTLTAEITKDKWKSDNGFPPLCKQNGTNSNLRRSLWKLSVTLENNTGCDIEFYGIPAFKVEMTGHDSFQKCDLLGVSDLPATPKGTGTLQEGGGSRISMASVINMGQSSWVVDHIYVEYLEGHKPQRGDWGLSPFKKIGKCAQKAKTRTRTYSDIKPNHDWVVTVKDQQGNTYHYSSSTQSSAEGRALKQCKQYDGRNCTITNVEYRGKQKKQNQNEITAGLFDDLADAVEKQDTQKQRQHESTRGTQAGMSLLLMMDVSGSMSDHKLAESKKAAIDTVNTVTGQYFEVGILAFSGECSDPIAKQQPFTTVKSDLVQFINSLQAAGGTPLGNALKAAHRYLNNDKSPNSRDQMIILLADGDDDCGNVDDVMNEMRHSGTIFRHETIGLDISPYSAAADQLKGIASRSGGVYHYAKNHTQLRNVFHEALDTMAILDMLKQFGRRNNVPTPANTGKTKNLLKSLDF